MNDESHRANITKTEEFDKYISTKEVYKYNLSNISRKIISDFGERVGILTPL